MICLQKALFLEMEPKIRHVIQTNFIVFRSTVQFIEMGRTIFWWIFLICTFFPYSIVSEPIKTSDVDVGDYQPIKLGRVLNDTAVENVNLELDRTKRVKNILSYMHCLQYHIQWFPKCRYLPEKR